MRRSIMHLIHQPIIWAALFIQLQSEFGLFELELLTTRLEAWTAQPRTRRFSGGRYGY
jgi:hypothetical protein